MNKKLRALAYLKVVRMLMKLASSLLCALGHLISMSAAFKGAALGAAFL
jgi:hypothetical protein